MHKYSILRLMGVLIFLCVLGVLCATVIYFWGYRFGLISLEGKVIAWFAIVFVLLCFLKLMRLNSYYSIFRRYSYATKKRGSIPALLKIFTGFFSSFSIHPSKNNEAEIRFFDELNNHLKNHYGYFWSCKVRILILTGKSTDLEQLVPGLITQYWQEDQGTLLLWGGDLNTPADTAWLTALRKLRRRPGWCGSRHGWTPRQKIPLPHSPLIRWTALLRR